MLKKSIIGLLSFLFILCLFACNQGTLNLDDLDIEAYDAIDIEAGIYTVEYTIDNLNTYMKQYSLEVHVTVMDQNDRVIDVSGNQFVVEENFVYTVTILIVNPDTEEIIKEKVITITAIVNVYLVDIEIITMPSKRSYTAGESFDSTGMIVEALYSNETRTLIDDYHYSSSPLQIGDETFAIHYQDKTTYVILTISSGEPPETLDTPTDLMMFGYGFYLFFSASMDAEVHEVWINGATYIIDLMMVDLALYLIEPIEYEIKIRSKAEGFNDSEYSESYFISMIIDYIGLESDPTSEYIEGDYLNTSEIVVLLYYTDQRFVYLASDDIVFSHTNPLTQDDTLITITHIASGKTVSFTIDVIDIEDAIWEVEFNGNGGTLVSGDEIQYIPHGSSAIAPIYSNKDLEFSGWNFTFDVVTNHMVISALWFDPEAGTAGLLYEPIYDEYYQVVYYEVTSYGGSSSHVVLPTVYNSFPVRGISSQAFFNNKTMTSITLSTSIEYIGWNAFFGVSNLTEIIVKEGNTFYAADNGLLYAIDFTRLIFVPEGKTGTLTVLEGVHTISDNAARNAIGITALSLPDSVHDIGANAFFNTAWLNNHEDGVVYAGRVAYAYKGSIPEDTVLELLEDTLGIAANAFELLPNIIDVIMPIGLITIGNHAFQGCTSLVYALIPITVERVGWGAFRFAENLEYIYIPDEVINVASDAFDYTLWSSLQPDGVVYLGNIALRYKGYMSPNTSIILREGTTAISTAAFAEYDNLVNIHIPNSVVLIGTSAFAGSHGLTKIYLSESVEMIGQGAFQNTNLTIYAQRDFEHPNWHPNWNPDPRDVLYNSMEPPIATDYILYFGVGIDTVTLTVPFISYIPEDIMPGFTVSAWYENEDLSGNPIQYPYQRSDKGSITLYAAYDVATYLVTFRLPEEWEHVGGGALVQTAMHGQAVVNPPIIEREGYKFLAWYQDIDLIEGDLTVVPLRAAILLSTTGLTSHGTWVSLETMRLPAQINLRLNVPGWDDYRDFSHGDSTFLMENTTISARVLVKDVWIDLDDIVVDFIETTHPSSPEITYFYDYDNLDNIIVRIKAGEKRPGAISDIAYTRYRLDDAEDWEIFTEQYHYISVPFGTVVRAGTYNEAGKPSNHLNQAAWLNTFVYYWDDVPTTRYSLRIEQYTQMDTIITVRLIGSLQTFTSTYYSSTVGELINFIDYAKDSTYIGCGPKAAEIFLKWFGSTYTQWDLVLGGYILAFPVGFLKWTDLFTAPSLLEAGIQLLMTNHMGSNFDVHSRSTNTTKPTVGLIQGFLTEGYPVIILSGEGDHWEVISESRVAWGVSGEYHYGSFALHDNGGKVYEEWYDIGYFFENQWFARIARITYSSCYRDTIISIREYMD